MPSASSAIRYARQNNTSPTECNILKAPDDKGLRLNTIPPAPEDLTEEAAIWWNYYCAVLFQGNCLKRTYLTSLHNLCLMHVIREHTMKIIEKQGFEIIATRESVDPETGYIEKIETSKINPLVKDFQKVLIDMDKLLASLGMTAYTDKVLEYDSTGHEAFKSAPPEVTFTPEKEN